MQETHHVLTFTPEKWGQVRRFQRFYFETYNLDQRQQRALAGVDAHFIKAVRLRSIAEKIRPNLALDITELEEKGYTPAHNSSEVATLIEAAILALYSSIDCTVKVLRVPPGST